MFVRCPGPWRGKNNQFFNREDAPAQSSAAIRHGPPQERGDAGLSAELFLAREAVGALGPASKTPSRVPRKKRPGPAPEFLARNGCRPRFCSQFPREKGPGFIAGFSRRNPGVSREFSRARTGVFSRVSPGKTQCRLAVFFKNPREEKTRATGAPAGPSRECAFFSRNAMAFSQERPRHVTFGCAERGDSERKEKEKRKGRQNKTKELERKKTTRTRRGEENERGERNSEAPSRVFVGETQGPLSNFLRDSPRHLASFFSLEKNSFRQENAGPPLGFSREHPGVSSPVLLEKTQGFPSGPRRESPDFSREASLERTQVPPRVLAERARGFI